MKTFFELRGKLSDKARLVTQVTGLLLLLGLWSMVTALELVPKSLFPSPLSVLKSFSELHFNDGLIRNLLYSLQLNMVGYVEAVLICIPIGMLIGLFPIANGLFSRPVDALRFVPLTAVTGLFIAWFGIDDFMKVQFLAFGIIVYLLPIVALRVSEVEDVYQQTAYTLGATKWQTIRKVFIPSVLAKLSDDIRVIVAISWTYIIVAEMMNKSGGIGALAHTAARQSRIDKVFALLFIIVLIGFLQDLAFRWLDKLIFKFKHVKAK